MRRNLIVKKILTCTVFAGCLCSLSENATASTISSEKIFHQEKQPRIVCIGGLISVGKTTFIANVNDWCKANGYSCKVMEEIKSPSMLNSQAKNMPTTVGFYFGHRIQMAIDAPEVAKNYDLVIMERSHIDHLAFVEAMESTNLLPEGTADWTKKAIQDVNPPNPITFIYLDISIEQAIGRQANRGDEYEKIFGLEFSKKLDGTYHRILKEQYANPIFLDWTNFGKEYNLDEIVKTLMLEISLN